jgi:flagellar basal-body rod protein FlgB
MDILFGKTMNLLSGMLDYRSTRHKVILSNVANIDTEGFKPSDVTFKQILGKTNTLEMSTTDPRHIGAKGKNNGSIEVTTSEEKVNIDTEMVNLAENHLMYNMTVDLLSRKFKGLNTVLKEGK